MKDVKLHCVAAVIIAPCLLTLSSGDLRWNLVGIAYILWLALFSTTNVARKWLKRYYRAVLRMENRL